MNTDRKRWGPYANVLDDQGGTREQEKPKELNAFDSDAHRQALHPRHTPPGSGKRPAGPPTEGHFVSPRWVT